MKEPKALITTGYDNLVKVWSLEGKLLGVLHQGSAQGRFLDKNWCFPVINRDQDQKVDFKVASVKQVQKQ